MSTLLRGIASLFLLTFLCDHLTPFRKKILDLDRKIQFLEFRRNKKFLTKLPYGAKMEWLQKI